MTELLRFQHLRPATALSTDRAQALGLALYPDETLTPLAQSLLLETDEEKYRALVARYLKAGKAIVQPSDINPVIRAFSHWLESKPSKISINDLDAFAATVDASKLPDLNGEWCRIADSFLAGIDQDLVATRYHVDFQLLVRICHLLSRVLAKADNGFKTKQNVAGVVTAILERPIILPAGLALSEHMIRIDKPNRMKVPKAPPTKPTDKPDCDCKCDDECRIPESYCVTFQPYVGDLFLIREELARYEAGDIADIENVLAGEMKQRKHRVLSRSEETLTAESESTLSSERDNSVNEKTNLQSEVKSAAEQKIHFDAGVTATLKYGESITITPHANVSGDWAKSQSQSIAKTYARELVSRAVTKVEEKTKKQAIEKTIREVEEKNRHRIKNDDPSAQHRAGLYFWVNRISHAQVMNYGRHLMFDLILPEPAATWRELYTRKMAKDEKTKAPQKPALTLIQIQPGSYGGLLVQFGLAGVDGLEPPDPQLAVEMAFSQNLGTPTDDKSLGFSSNDFRSPDIPDGYEATSADYSIRCSVGHPKSTDGWRDQASVSVSVAGHKIFDKQMYEWDQNSNDVNQPNQEWVNAPPGKINLPGVRGTLTVAVAGFSSLPLALTGSITITAVPSTELMEAWRLRVLNTIMADYRRKLEAYESEKDGNATLFSIKGRNPFLNREIERNELKRHIIAALMCSYFPNMGAIVGRASPCGYPEIDFRAMDKVAPVIQFFEQVFEWEYLTYLFYHSMWARHCKWVELVWEDSGDPLFDKFLTAGASRVQVPIRPGMEKIFLWFQATGQLWGATGEPPVPGDAEYVSMIQELKEARQGEYVDRPGLIAATNGSTKLLLSKSEFYWDALNGNIDAATIANDIDREIIVDFKTYRIVDVVQTVSGDSTQWTITIERGFEGATATALQHGAGAIYVGAPWEVKTPTQLVYLRNPTDRLPTYPLV